MEGNNISVGLDIGTTKIVAMIGRRNEYGKAEILGIGKSKSLGVHRGVVNNITQTIQSIQQAVQEAEAASGVKIEEVTVLELLDRLTVIPTTGLRRQSHLEPTRGPVVVLIHVVQKVAKPNLIFAADMFVKLHQIICAVGYGRHSELPRRSVAMANKYPRAVMEAGANTFKIRIHDAPKIAAFNEIHVVVTIKS